MAASTIVPGNYLQQHAYKNVWCTPKQDKQACYKLARLSKNGGVWNTVIVLWRTVDLPNQDDRFHVYQVGQLHPILMGLSENSETWVNLVDVCNDDKLVANFYNENGVQIHRSHVWYMVTRDKNLIVAVKIPDKTKFTNLDLNTQSLYMRLYSNAFYTSQRDTDADDLIFVYSKYISETDDILDFQNTYNTWNAKTSGKVQLLKNGYASGTVTLMNTAVGDYLEFLYDGSVKKKVSFTIGELPQFTSTLDSLNKYLLHYSGVTDIIDYQDDIDIELVLPNATSGFTGVYYHRNNPKAIRMVTHKDYSVATMIIAAYRSALSDVLGSSVGALQLNLYIRDSGWDRPLVDEDNRIQQLYTLDDNGVVEALTDANAVVSVWNAANLEASNYTAIMRADMGTITTAMVQSAYGYNACSILIGDTPMKTTTSSSNKVITLPYGLRTEATAYEYDVDGHLLGWHAITGGYETYTASSTSVDLVEVIAGVASESFTEWRGEQTSTIDRNYNYRMYTCDIVNSLPNNTWTDVTGTGAYSISSDQVITWGIDSTKYQTVRSNKTHVVYTLSYMVTDGLITFSLRQYRSDLSDYRVLSIPPGKIEIFLNKKPLINGLDFIVDFPRVTIINKEYLTYPLTTGQEITIRMTGFCQSDLTIEPYRDYGFVQYGVLSKNNVYDIRADKVNRVVVDGALYRYDELEYAEGDYTVSVTDARNGAPYVIDDIVVPMNKFLVAGDGYEDPTYDMRKASQAIDTVISGFMTDRIPEKEPTVPSIIPQRYQVVSPFIIKIFYDLVNGDLTNTAFSGQYSDQFVQSVCASYEWLLKYDPITDYQPMDSNYVVIHPHNLNNYASLSADNYRFLLRVVNLYANGKIDLSAFINVV